MVDGGDRAAQRVTLPPTGSKKWPNPVRFYVPVYRGLSRFSRRGGRGDANTRFCLENGTVPFAPPNTFPVRDLATP